MCEGNALEFLAYKINKTKLTVCFGLLLVNLILNKIGVHLFRNTVFTKMQDKVFSLNLACKYVTS